MTTPAITTTKTTITTVVAAVERKRSLPIQAKRHYLCIANLVAFQIYSIQFKTKYSRRSSASFWREESFPFMQTVNYHKTVKAFSKLFFSNSLPVQFMIRFSKIFIVFVFSVYIYVSHQLFWVKESWFEVSNPKCFMDFYLFNFHFSLSSSLKPSTMEKRPKNLTNKTFGCGVLWRMKTFVC